MGQTASGKTSLALKVAREFHLPIISADAYQCYRMMSIGTDKPTKEEIGDIPFYFYDEYDPDKPVSVYEFQKECRPVLDRYQKEEKDVLVVGGTFLYIKALLYPYVFQKEEEEDSHRYEDLSLEELQKKLLELSPEVYAQIDHKNPRRLIRAIRQIEEGHPRDEILSQNQGVPLYPTSFIRIDVSKEEGDRKIDERVDKMFSEGFEAEVRRLLEKYPKNLRSFSAIGYKEIISAMEANQPIDEKVKDLIKVHTHQYAKKQRTFLRHQFSLTYNGSKEECFSYLENELKNKE